MDAADRALVASWLGREPAGMVAVEARCAGGHPQVVRVHPLSRDAAGRPVPVPTLYWLTCPGLSTQVARLEAGGLIRRLDALLARDPALLAAHHADHLGYIEARWAALSPGEREAVLGAGYLRAFRHRGIAGVLDWSTVKCLHAQVALHRVSTSALGAWLEERHPLVPCS